MISPPRGDATPNLASRGRHKGRRASAVVLADLQRAAANLDFGLQYQAEFSLLSGRVTTFEALLRWRHPVLGDVPPQTFVGLAEQEGLIVRIGSWVLEQACREARKWPAEISVAVNVSPAQVESGLVRTVLSVLERTGLPPHRLELEMTESAMMPSGEASIAALHALRAVGVRIAIDDFDSGYASFGHLVEFPFDKLKIDGSLVAKLGSGHSRATVARAVVRSIVALCQEVDVACTAEGVETEAQMAVLAELGCTEVQGFLLAQPVEAVEIPEVLRRADHSPVPRVAAPRLEPLDVSFFQVAESACDVIIVTNTALDPPGPAILYVNPAFTRLTGFSAGEAIGRSPRILQGPGTSRSTLDRISAALIAGEPVHEKVLNYAKSGAPYWLDLRIAALRDRDGRTTHFVAIERDVTMDKRRSDELEELADRDALTGIPNRRALMRAIEAEVATAHDQLIARASAPGPSLALIDVDYFKQVNDTFGHQTGDAVLFGLADRLAENVRRVDVLGRLGGEEFAVCMPHLPLAGAIGLAERLRSVVEIEPFDTPNGPVSITVSIGVAGFTATGIVSDLLNRADSALYDAKRAGRNVVRYETHENCT